MTILLQGDMVETEACRSLKRLCSNSCLWSKTISKCSFHTGFIGLSPNLSLFVILLRTPLHFFTGSRDFQIYLQLDEGHTRLTIVANMVQRTNRSFCNYSQLDAHISNARMPGIMNRPWVPSHTTIIQLEFGAVSVSTSEFGKKTQTFPRFGLNLPVWRCFW